MPIRLFTSGSHKSVNGTLNFSNDDVNQILAKTQKADMEQIPFVLGHPKNNLPIVGWLPKSKIKIYTEGDKVSLGFDREAAELSEESMKLIREVNHNKISVRIEDGGIRHIGLVTKAAVEENNAQNFSQAELSGIFHTQEDILEKQQNDFSKILSDFKTEIKSLFKPNSMAEEKKEQNASPVDLSALMEQNKQLAESLAALQQTVVGFVGKAKATADFSAEEYKNLSAAQKETAATLVADLGSEESKTALKGLLKELAKPAVVVKNGSVAADFGKAGDQDPSLRDVIKEQIDKLK